MQLSHTQHGRVRVSEWPPSTSSRVQEETAMLGESPGSGRDFVVRQKKKKKKEEFCEHNPDLAYLPNL